MKHKHCELIKAWADGAEIERDYDNGNDNIGDWEVEHNPSWRDDMTYRIKQAKPSKLDVLRKTWEDASKAAAPAYEAYYAELNKEKK